MKKNEKKVEKNHKNDTKKIMIQNPVSSWKTKKKKCQVAFYVAFYYLYIYILLCEVNFLKKEIICR